ncbi:MAG: GAF domain-containing protein [Pirellulales bacterium]|nr:GAF domain-containing protein [Pirellulales bacterium]
MSTMAVDNIEELSAALGVPADEESQNPCARQETALLSLGRRCNAPHSRAELMQAAADLLAGRLGADFSGVGEISPDQSELRLRLTAVGGDNAVDEPLLYGDPLDPEKSLSSYALREAAPVASEDLFQEKRFTDSFLRDHGLRGALAVPLLVDGEPYGLVGAYSAQPRPIAPGELQFAETVALMLSAGLAQSRAEERFRREEKFSRAVLGLIDALILVLNPQGHVEQINSFAMQVSGFTCGEVQGKPLGSVFFQPRDEQQFRECLRRCVRENSTEKMENELLAKNGQCRRVRWSLQALANDEGSIYAVLMLGVDCTAEREKANQTERLRLVAEEAARIVRKNGLPEESTMRLRGLLAKAPLADLSDDALPDDATEPLRETPAPSPNRIDQRRHPRRSYRYCQKIAPLTGNAPPSPEQFFEVVCEDISAGGFSFYFEREPDFQQLVVALGQDSDTSYFIGQVVRNVPKKFQGRDMYLIGCRFNGRL